MRSRARPAPTTPELKIENEKTEKPKQLFLNSQLSILNSRFPRCGFQRATFGAGVFEEAFSQRLFISVWALRVLIPHIALPIL
jgi:hypothetical protein